MSISPARPLTIALDARILQGEDAWRGIGHYSQGLIEALLVHQEENRLEIVLILSRERPEPELQTAGARAIRHIAAPDPSPGPWRKIAGRLQDEASSDARALEKAALGEGADLLHILSPLHGPSNWRATRRIPCAATVYDLIPLKDPAHFLDQWPEAARERYLRRVKQLRDVDLLFPISHAVRSDLIDDLGLNADRITVASPGLRFDPDAGADSAKPRQRFLMALCSRNPSKNLPNLLSGYAGVPLEIRSAYPLHLFCPPDPETRHWLEKECAARSLGEEARIEPAPSDSDLLALYRDTTLFILPSLAEGFGLPALEAGSQGTAVAASDLPVLREVLGPGAFYFDPRDPASISMCLSRALGDGDARRSCGETVREHSRIFRWDETAKVVATAYRDYLARR